MRTFLLHFPTFSSSCVSICQDLVPTSFGSLTQTTFFVQVRLILRIACVCGVRVCVCVCAQVHPPTVFPDFFDHCSGYNESLSVSHSVVGQEFIQYVDILRPLLLKLMGGVTAEVANGDGHRFLFFLCRRSPCFSDVVWCRVPKHRSSNRAGG